MNLLALVAVRASCRPAVTELLNISYPGNLTQEKYDL